MKSMWNDRYGKIEFAYGEQPNNFLKEQLIKIPAGTIISSRGRRTKRNLWPHKAGMLMLLIKVSRVKESAKANKHDVAINYEVGEFQSIGYQENQFDAIALIYAHFPADKKSSYHKILTTYLRPGGIVIFEAFSKKASRLTAKKRESRPKTLIHCFQSMK
jgi:hypothetical protein